MVLYVSSLVVTNYLWTPGILQCIGFMKCPVVSTDKMQTLISLVPKSLNAWTTIVFRQAYMFKTVVGC